MIQAILLATAVLLAPQVSKHVDTDTVRLRDSKELKGRVVFEDDERVILRVKGKEREIPLDEVAEVRSLERSLAEYIERFDAIDGADPVALTELARFCEQRGLTHEALHCWVRVVFADPTNADAFKALEGRESSQKGWQVKVGKRWRTLEEVKEIHGDWKEAWELETVHFRIKTDLPAEEALGMALGIERNYLTFYAAMRQVLPLRVFEWLPAINVYEQASAFPSPPVPVDAWFYPGRNELDVLALEGWDPHLVLGQVAQVMLYNSLRQSSGKTGRLPSWVTQGIADLFGASWVGAPGELELEPGAEHKPYFREHGTAPQPIPLKRILTEGNMGFYTGSNSELARAEAYTLVYFLVFGEDQRYAEGFGRYLESAYGGQSSETHLKTALGVDDLSTLEAAWHAYARARAGA